MAAVLSVKIISDHKDAAKGFEETGDKANKFAGGLEKANGAALAVGGGLALAAVKVGSMAEEAARGEARILALTENLGGFGAQTDEVASKVTRMGEKLAKTTGIDPNAVKSSQALLLSFENLAVTADKTGGVFDRATKASANLAAAGLGEMEEVSKSLGEALQDPVNELGALGEVGIRFSESQQKAINKMVESGDIAGAQAVILGRVEKKVGGVGAATATASDKMKVGWQLAAESLGQKLLPAFEKLSTLGLAAVTWITENSDLVLVLAGVLGGLAGAVIAVNTAVKVWSSITKAATAIQAAFNFVMALNPITLVVLAIIALTVAFVIAYKKVDWFREAVDKTWAWIKNAAVTVWDFLSKTIPAKVEALKDAAVDKFHAAKDGISDAITGAKNYVINGFTTIRDRAVGYVRDLKNDIVSTITGIPGKFRDMAGDVIDGLIWGLQWGGGRVVDAITGVVGGAIDAAKRMLGIASPSKVFKYLGDMTVKGFESSVVKGRKSVRRAYDELLTPPDAPRVALDVVGARPGTRTPGRSPVPARPPVTVNFNGVVTDPRGVARELIEVLERHYAMTGEAAP